ncbi:C-type lectin domain family 12 member A-like isoform X2 [Pelodiscus sinensis]|uniref:C-type lectin domain family 12 member A-like isoform X2 n=1 Tax=Pelodiscus sinensis TaxID=13735 RepID=UPI003F6AE4F2
MTEEITYADLEFNKCYALENIPKPAAPEEKGLPPSCPTWRLAALTFLTLCLALLVGLLILGIMCPSCILCPVNWQWMGGDTCFYISMQKKSWEESRQFCSLQNSTLLMLKDREKLNHVPPRDKSQYYWIGLHKSESAGWLWEDGSDLLTEKADWIGSYQFYRCGYLHGLMISNHDYCTMKHFWICEKAVFKLST